MNYFNYKAESLMFKRVIKDIEYNMKTERKALNKRGLGNSYIMYKLKTDLQITRGKLLQIMDKEIELREDARIERLQTEEIITQTITKKVI